MANDSDETSGRSSVPPLSALLALASVGALTPEQARGMAETWGELDADIWSQPEYRSVREHTRFVIERMRVKAE